MSSQDTVENKAAVIPYLPEKWDNPEQKSILKACRNEMLRSVTVCAAIKNMKSDEPSFAHYVVEDEELCENVVSIMGASGEFLESDTVDMMLFEIEHWIFEDESYDYQLIVDPDSTTNPTCAIDLTESIEDDGVMEIVVAVVYVGSEEDKDGCIPYFFLVAEAEYGDGEGFLSVIKRVYDEYGNGMFDKSDYVKVFRIQMTVDDALMDGRMPERLFPLYADTE